MIKMTKQIPVEVALGPVVKAMIPEEHYRGVEAKVRVHRIAEGRRYLLVARAHDVAEVEKLRARGFRAL